MSGNRAGGLKAKETNLKNNPNFYRDIGKLSSAGWEKNGRKPRGFATMSPEKLREVSAKGGRAYAPTRKSN